MSKFENNIEQESVEPIEALLESSLEHGVKFDEGQNAIVLEVNAVDLDQGTLNSLFMEEELSEEELVSKVLRVFNAGHSEKEANQQLQAKEIIESQDEETREGLAKIPEIYTHKDITIHSQELKDKLINAGVEVASDQVGVLLMYKVQGVDFLNYLLREAIKRCPKDVAENKVAISNTQNQLEIDSRQVSTEDIFKAASVAVGFEDSEHITLNKTNRARLLDYLKKHDFILDLTIIEKIEKTTSILNDNDFYHNDLTERNFMLELDDAGQATEIYLIDFEKSSDQEDKEFGGDMAIVGRYKSLTKSKNKEIEEAIDQTILSVTKLRDRIAKARPEINDSIRDDLSRMLKEKNDENLRHIEAEAFITADSIVSDQAWKLLSGILLKISETNPKEVKEYIAKKMEDDKTPVIYVNFLSRIAKNL